MPYEEVEKLIRKEPLEDHYELGQELGRGKFAIVKRCKDKRSGLSYAAKFLRKRRGGRACRDAIVVEIDIMRQALGHQRVVTLHEVFESTREMIIILELASGGELFRMIAVDPLPEDKAREVVWQLLEGVSHLHNLSIVHLDLKPENILLERKGSLDIKIADFGLALQISPGQRVQTLVGTAEYVAPEILNYEPLSIAADLWSIGALTYALLAGYSPFQGDTHNETFLNVSMCDYDFDDEVFDDVSQEAKDFIEDLLIKEPKNRLPVEKCLAHPWIKARSVPIPSTQINEGLNSSTSSLDSALCLDSSSSLEPSPCSSASSSFAPRPSAKPADDRDDADNLLTPVDFRQVTEKVSKLCTETQKAEVQSSRPKPASVDEQASLIGNLDGSVSSISSTESSRTVKMEDDETLSSNAQDKAPESDSSVPCVSPTISALIEGKRSPSEDERNRQTSISSSTDEEPGRISRPSSALRATTPTFSDVTSLAPETVEKLKKFERLKQRMEENKYSTLPSPRKNKCVSEQSVSSSQLVQPNCKEGSSLHVVTKENIAKRPLAASKSLSPQPTPADPGPGKSQSGTELSKTRSVSPPTLVSSHKPSLPTVEEKRVEDMRSQSPKMQEGRSDKRILAPVKDRQLSESPKPPTTTATPKVAVGTAVIASPISSSSVKQSESPVKSSPSRTSPQAEPASRLESNSDAESVICTPTSQAAKQVPVLENSLTTHSQYLSGTSSNEPRAVTVQRRQKSPMSKAHQSWRQTPHIDPDAIDAILRGDFSEADLKAVEKKNSLLESFAEEESPSLQCSTSEGRVQAHSPPSPTKLLPTHLTNKSRTLSGVCSSRSASSTKVSPPPTVRENDVYTVVLNSPVGLAGPRRSGHPNSDVIMRVKSTAISSNRRQMVAASTPVFDENLIYGSPLQSPSGLGEQKSSHDIESPPKHHRLSSLQSSMTLSRSTPDLSAIIGASKSAKRHKPKEDSYVTDTRSSRTSSVSRRTPLHNRSSANIRTTLLSGGNIVRSLTISGKHAKRNASNRPGYKY